MHTTLGYTPHDVKQRCVPSYGEFVTRRRTRKTTPGFWEKKTTGEIMVLVITFTVCFGVLASGVTIAILAIFRPSIDITLWASRITGIMNTMIGLLAGFLAGRTDYKTSINQPPPEDRPSS
jgi:hypothetical protein